MGIPRGTYRPLETAMTRRGLKVSAGSIWDYMHSGKLPTRAVTDRFAAFFSWNPDEVWRIRVRAQRQQDDAILHDPSGLHTAAAVGGGMMSPRGAAVGAGTEATLLAEVALPLLTGDMTAEERAYLQEFVRRVNQRRAQSGGVRDEPGRSGAGGPAD